MNKTQICLVGAVAASMLIPGMSLAQQSLIVDSSGDVGIGTSTPATSVHVLRGDNTATLLVEETAASTKQELFKLTHNGFPQFRFTDASTNAQWDFRLSARGTPSDSFEITRVGTGTAEFWLDSGGDANLRGTLTVGGLVNTGSSRTIKKNMLEVNPSDVLATVSELPILTWQYKKDEIPAVHMGPVAEEFYGAFNLGKDNKHIAATDMAGVALAAIKGLKQEQDRVISEKDAEIEALKTMQLAQQEELDSLKEMLKLLVTSDPIAAQ